VLGTSFAAVLALLAPAGIGRVVHAQSDPVPGTPDPLETAGAASATGGGFAVTGVLDRPPAPAPPAVIARDALGRATVRAVKLAAGLRLDGVLDEPVFALEERQKRTVMGYLYEYAHREQLSWYYSVHELELSAEFSDYVALFRPDQPPLIGPTAEIHTRDP